MEWLKKYKFLVRKQLKLKLYSVMPSLTEDQLNELEIPYNKSKGGVRVKTVKDPKQPTLRELVLNMSKDIKEIKGDIVEMKADIKAMKNTPTMKSELKEMKK